MTTSQTEKPAPKTNIHAATQKTTFGLSAAEIKQRNEEQRKSTKPAHIVDELHGLPFTE